MRFGDPAALAVLLVMGTLAQAIGWPDELVGVLAGGGLQVIRFDHRDTAQSDCVDFAAAPYMMTDMAHDSLAMLDGRQVPSAHIAGASPGGVIGQLLAVHRPDRVQAAANHDLAGRQMVPGWDAPLSRITAPTLVSHGTADPLHLFPRPPAHGPSDGDRGRPARPDAHPRLALPSASLSLTELEQSGLSGRIYLAGYLSGRQELSHPSPAPKRNVRG